MSGVLLSREQFRTTALSRHGGACCLPGCPASATDAHHIVERRLFTAVHEAGGYFAANAAGLCPQHHRDAEATVLGCEKLRAYCGITEVVLPEHLDPASTWTKWGDEVLTDGTRVPGELFHTAAVQTLLRRHGLLSLYRQRMKYPRTFHAPWSPGICCDDKVQHDLSVLAGTDVVITEKLDGECTSVYPDGACHARSVDSGPHPSRDYVRALAGRVGHELPATFRLTGENCFAEHSVGYTALPDFFLLFGVWDRDRCLGWDDVETWAGLLGLATVPVIYRGSLPSPADCDRMWREATAGRDSEGYVIRAAGAFPLAEFARRVVKVVRAGHVTTGEHWLHRPLVVNGLAAGRHR